MDKRRQRSRAALLRAFAELIQAHAYEDIRVPDIVQRAQVGRSTFYENFRGKDGILVSSIAGPFSALAACVRAPAPGTAATTGADLAALLEHFWSNRRLARGLFMGPVRARTTAVLVAQIEQIVLPKSRASRLPRRLVAIQLAEVLLAPIVAWLLGEFRCTPQALAVALPRAAHAVLAAADAAVERV